LYAFNSLKYVGIEIWQVKSGSVFGNFLVTDDVELAKSEAAKILTRVEGERAAEAAAEAKEAEAARLAAEEEEVEVEEKEDL
jgi:calreticulin